MTTKPSIYANLPKVVMLLGIDDAGEGGAAVCPHCGASGRYVYHFMAEDGQMHGAMRGCYARFPKHPFAALAAELLKKQIDAKARGRSLASWDVEELTAVTEYAHGRMSEDAAQTMIDRAERSKRAWMVQRGYARR